MQICPRNKWRSADFLNSIVARHLLTARLSTELFNFFLSQSRYLSIARNKWRSADSLKLDSCSIASYLSRFNKAQQILSIDVSIENYENRFYKFDFWPMLMYLCRVSFLTTLNIYKAYFRECHKREYKENICKRWPMPYSLWKKLLRLLRLKVL